MGVMTCDRKGCERILCDRYSSEYGYICYTCFSELVDRDPKDIEAFMSKKPKKGNRDFNDYDRIFPISR